MSLESEKAAWMADLDQRNAAVREKFPKVEIGAGELSVLALFARVGLAAVAARHSPHESARIGLELVYAPLDAMSESHLQNVLGGAALMLNVRVADLLEEAMGPGHGSAPVDGGGE